VVAAIAVALAVSASAFADPPGRVARLSYTSGAVSFRPASLDEWSTATINYPLTIGDHIWTDRNSRSELQIGSLVVRIAPSTELSLLNLNDRTAQIRVTQGAVSVRVRALDSGDIVEIDTPNGVMTAVQPGLYRVDVSDAGDSSNLVVHRGYAEVTAGGSNFPLRDEQGLEAVGLDMTQTTLHPVGAYDDFESWALARDRAAERLRAAQYVPAGMIGYEDLDANGDWYPGSEYGAVWIPRVRTEWVPYHYGHWVWVDPWGWTWIDDAPWGFAPFHYGRWVYLPGRSRWAWAPGTVVARPVYAPALVAFVGGSRWSASFSIGTAPVAWFPLGPREVYVPAYHVSPVYVQQVNAAHVTNINVTNINVTNVTYVNRGVPGAVTAVPRSAFVAAQPVANAAVAVTPAQVQAAPVIGASAQIAPQRESIAGRAQAAAVVAPPAAVVARQVVVRNAPPPPPVAFAAQRAALDAHPGQPIDTASVAAIRGAAPAPAHPLVRAVAAPAAAPNNRPVQAAPRAPIPQQAPVSAPQIPVAPAAAPRSAPAPAPQVAPTPAPQIAEPRSVPQRAPAPAPAPQTAAPAPQVAAPRQATPAPQPTTVAPAPPRPVPPTPAEIAARHEQERAQLDARHQQEVKALQAQHQQQVQAAADARARDQIKAQHQQEMKALQERQKQERDAVQKRQQAERKQR